MDQFANIWLFCDYHSELQAFIRACQYNYNSIYQYNNTDLNNAIESIRLHCQFKSTNLPKSVIEILQHYNSSRDLINDDELFILKGLCLIAANPELFISPTLSQGPTKYAGNYPVFLYVVIFYPFIKFHPSVVSDNLCYHILQLVFNDLNGKTITYRFTLDKNFEIIFSNKSVADQLSSWLVIGGTIGTTGHQSSFYLDKGKLYYKSDQYVWDITEWKSMYDACVGDLTWDNYSYNENETFGIF